MTASRHLITPKKQWQPWELELMTELYPHVQAHVIAWFCNCQLGAVYSCATRLGLKKDAATVAEIAHENSLRPDHGGKRTRFQKGAVPVNKGLKGVCHPGSVPTQFRKGQKPHTWKPIGTERLSDGYLQRKVTDTGYPPRNWAFVHVLVWQEHHGKQVPKGHAITFVDGNKQNLDPSNLKCVSRAELMSRNTIHRYPQPLKHAIRLVKKLERAINEKQK